MAAKYNNKITVVDGIRFDSNAEAARYTQLLILAHNGDIFNLELQPRFDLAPGCVLNGKKKQPLRYIADFRYIDKSGEIKIEDYKGVRTAVYRIKQHLMKTVHNIDIIEIRS